VDLTKNLDILESCKVVLNIIWSVKIIFGTSIMMNNSRSWTASGWQVLVSKLSHHQRQESQTTCVTLVCNCKLGHSNDVKQCEMTEIMSNICELLWLKLHLSLKFVWFKKPW